MNLSVDLYKDVIVNGVRFKIYKIKDNKLRKFKFSVLEEYKDIRWFEVGDYNNPREAMNGIKEQFEIEYC